MPRHRNFSEMVANANIDLLLADTQRSFIRLLPDPNEQSSGIEPPVTMDYMRRVRLPDNEEAAERIRTSDMDIQQEILQRNAEQIVAQENERIIQTVADLAARTNEDTDLLGSYSSCTSAEPAETLTARHLQALWRHIDTLRPVGPVTERHERVVPSLAPGGPLLDHDMMIHLRASARNVSNSFMAQLASVSRMAVQNQNTFPSTTPISEEQQQYEDENINDPDA